MYYWKRKKKLDYNNKRTDIIHKTPPPNANTAVPADAEIIENICNTWGLDAEKWTWWS